MNQMVPVIIPAFEPDQRMIDLLEKMKEYSYGPVIVVNDGSGDKYKDIFQKAQLEGAVVLEHRVNRGKGAALKTGFRYVKEHEPDAIGVVTADCDGQHTPSDIRKVAEELMKHPDCLILGSRSFDEKDIPWKSRFGNRLTAKIFSLVCGVRVNDTQTGLRGIPVTALDECLQIREDRFAYEMEMLMEYDRKKIMEVPIQTVYDSAEHHATHFNVWKDSFRIYMVLLRKFFTFVLSSLSSAVIDVGLFTILEKLLKTAFPMLAITIATVLARICSSLYNYMINRKVVFRSKQKASRTTWQYYLLVVIQMAASAGLTNLGAYLFPDISVTVIKMISDVLLFLISYQLQNRLIF